MRVLAFESSCDETCAAVVDGSATAITVSSNVVSSQVDIHKLYGGVVPEIASRNHALAILPVCEEAMKHTPNLYFDAVCATTGPGLRGAVMVGQIFGESYALARGLPFVPVNHLAGHIASIMLTYPVTPNGAPPLSRKGISAPFLALLVSGGHTSLYHVKSWGEIRCLRETADDAVGETFDKVGKMLGLEYPAVPKIEKLAAEYAGNDYIKFVGQGTGKKKEFFTYSGLKTAVLAYIQKSPAAVGGTPFNKGELSRVCASFQREAVGQLIEHSVAMLKKLGLRTLAVCGGVSANGYLRAEFVRACGEVGARVVFPPVEYCTDNAAMIGAAAILGAKILDENA